MTPALGSGAALPGKGSLKMVRRLFVRQALELGGLCAAHLGLKHWSAPRLSCLVSSREEFSGSGAVGEAPLGGYGCPATTQFATLLRRFPVSATAWAAAVT